MAFADCSALKEVYCEPTTPPSGGFDMFDNNASGRKIYVPTASVDAYKAADGWKEYADAIVAKKCSASFEPMTYTWNYVDDAAVDADKLANGNSATLYYKRDFALNLATAVINQFPEDTNLTNVLVSKPVSIMVNDVNVADMVSFSNNYGNVVLHFSHFEWNKEYKVVAMFSSQDTDIEVTFDIKTIDRNRTTPVKVEQTFGGYVFAKDYAFAAFDGVAPEMAINKVYTDVAALYDLTGITEAAFLKDVFVEKMPYAMKDVITPTTNANLDFLFNSNGNEVSVAYNFSAWRDIPLDVTYTKNITLWYGQEVELVVKVVIALPTNYNFEYSSLFVQNTGSGLEAYTQPIYYPSASSSALYAFDSPQANLLNAFYIVDNNMDMSEEQIAELGLVAEFSLKNEYNFSAHNSQFSDPTMHRYITMSNNKLVCRANVDEVPVYGGLYIVNSNGSRVKLTTNFDSTATYKNFVVKGYNPISEPYTTSSVINIDVSDSIIHSINPLEYVNLYDYRNGYRNYALITNGMFVMGNGINGFRSGISARDVYSINCELDMAPISAALSKIISFNTYTGEIIFNNSSGLALTAPINISVTLKITSPWCEYTIDIPFRFYQNN